MTIQSLFDDALLAQAAYAVGLKSGMTDSELEKELLRVDGVTPAQAKYFVSKYKVVEQVENANAGFSATLFENKETPEYHLATRGTDSSKPRNPDWIDANVDNVFHGASYDQVADLLNFYLRLTHAQTETVAQFAFEELVLASDAPPPSVPHVIIGTLDTPTITKIRYAVFSEVASENGLEAITNDQELSLAGHSLGGHLASVFTLLFPNIVNSTATFNSAGFIGHNFDEFASIISEVVNTNGVANLNPDPVSNSSVDVINIRSLLDPVSDLPIFGNFHLGGNTVEVFIESNSLFTSHGVDSLVDSLAVINFLNTLDENITLQSARQLLMNSSNRPNTSLESMMSYMAELFSEISVAKTDSDHDGIYNVIDTIVDSLDGKTYQISPITNSIVNEAASGDKAALYALINLQPFVVRGATQGITDALYQNHSADGALDAENFSEQYLIDRAAMLHWLTKYNEEDTDYGDLLTTNDINGNFIFTDLASSINNFKDLALQIDGVGGELPYQHIKFGTEYDDGIAGAANDDRLYGGGGKDSILGKDS
jgi:hypothetical protein